MIVDFHTHAFPDALAQRGLEVLQRSADYLYKPVTDMTIGGLLGYMDAHGIDVSVIQPVITKASQTRGINEWAASVQSDRIISFGGVYAHTDDYRRDIDFVVSLGLRGLKFHAEYQDFVLDAPEMLKIYDYALSKGLILFHHAGEDPGFSPPYKTSPRQFLNVSKAMKGGVIIAAHLGGHAQWDDVEKYIVGSDIYIDTSMGMAFYPREQFLRIAHNHGRDKLLFASDSPWSDAASDVQEIKGLPLDDELKENILYKNALKLLKIGGKN